MDLNVEIFAHNMDVTDRIRDYVIKKVSKFDRFLLGIDEVRVDLDFVKSARMATDRHVAQITIRGKNYILRSEERADDMFAAIDTAVEKIQRRIERFKGKRSHGRGDGKSASEVAGQVVEPEEENELEPVIARRKHFTLSPMDENEAIEQMTLLGHEAFFVFYNANTNKINVLYRRRDESYGLIEPEVG
jgi:putative sigma-54 modulation protein